jgi:hypothetical protein
MSEFDHHSSAEKKLSSEKLQLLLTSTSTWLRSILNEKSAPDDIDSVALVPATPDELYYQNKHGSLSVYDLIDGVYVEFSQLNTAEETLGITHYLLKQTADGSWQLQTTGDLYRIPSLHLDFDEWRGLELSDHDERLSTKEPLYPEYLEPANADEILLFHEIIERGAFGDSRFDFSDLDVFMRSTAAIANDIEQLKRNNSES